jgi:predicted carbohydrate-binding protein with CBM5 and CBM33 domain
VNKLHTRSFLLLVLMLTVVLLTVTSAHAAIGFVQVRAGTVSSASTESLAFSSNTTAGNIILVGSTLLAGHPFLPLLIRRATRSPRLAVS